MWVKTRGENCGTEGRDGWKLCNVSVLAHFSQQPGKVYIIVIAPVSRLSAKAQRTGLRVETVKCCF